MALFVALGGTGYAASGALSDGGSPQATIARSARRARRSLRGPRGFRGRTGATGATGATGPAGAQGAQGPAGTAKAFAEVSNTGRTVSGHTANITDANITHPSAGVYCFDLSRIGITTANAAAVVSLDYNDGQTNTGEVAHINVGPSFNACPAGQPEVRTYDTTPRLADAGFVVAFM
jgi:hypothetical protein